MTDRLQEMDERTLRLNLFFTQGIVLTIALISSLFFRGWEKSLLLFTFPGWKELLFATLTAIIIVIINILSEKFLPTRWQDDGDINKRIFLGLSLPSTLLLCILVGIGEEWLFRGVIQPYIGNGWTSLLFTLIHFRYLREPLLVISVFVTSYLLGSLFDMSHRLLAPIAAHALIDFTLALYLQLAARKERRA